MRLVVLVSGSGTLLQALIDARTALGVEIVAVGADRDAIAGLDRAVSTGIPTFVEPFAKGEDRSAWDARLTAAVAAHEPDLVVSAGFMKLLGPAFLERFGGRTINTHPALLPSFPGMHGPRDALAHGVKVSGATVFMVDAGVDTGRILAQRAVDVLDTDTVETLHDRIKVAERALLLEVVAELATEGDHVPGPHPMSTSPGTASPNSDQSGPEPLQEKQP